VDGPCRVGAPPPTNRLRERRGATRMRPRCAASAARAPASAAATRGRRSRGGTPGIGGPRATGSASKTLTCGSGAPGGDGWLFGGGCRRGCKGEWRCGAGGLREMKANSQLLRYSCS